ncbi:MAG: SMC-Scp complex subunit ScpB [Parvibaculum sp.]
MVVRPPPPLDTELADLPDAARLREWMMRVEAAVFASADPVPREVLARLVGRACNLDLLIADIRAELKARPYDLVPVAGGYAMRTRPELRDAIRAALPGADAPALTRQEMTVLMGIAYYQPVTRDQLGWILGYRVEGRQIDRDLIGKLRRFELVANGPRSPEPGAPVMYVTTPAFLQRYGLTSLDALPERERLEESGLLDKARILAQRKALMLQPDASLSEPDTPTDEPEPLEI